MYENQLPQEEDLATREAKKRVEKIKKFYRNLASWASTSIFLIAINIFLAHGITWAKYPVFFWGIAIAMQFFEILRLQRMDKKWEEKMINKHLGRTSLPNPDQQETEDYSEELLRDQDLREKEKADLSNFRKLKKPWSDDDLV